MLRIVSTPGWFRVDASGMATLDDPQALMDTEPTADRQQSASWLPMIVIAMAQILLIFNVSTLQVSIEGIVSSFNVPATVLGTAIVTYSLVVAGFIMLGAKLGQAFGSRRVFRASPSGFFGQVRWRS